MTFAVLTAKHESGFCLWPSADYDYDSPKPIQGRHHRRLHCRVQRRGHFAGRALFPAGRATKATRIDGPVPKIYFNLIKKQITELHTKYPGLRLQALTAPNVLAGAMGQITKAIKQVNPRCQIIDHSRGGVAHYADATVNQGWMWRANQKMNPASSIVQRLQQSAISPASVHSGRRPGTARRSSRNSSGRAEDRQGNDRQSPSGRVRHRTGSQALIMLMRLKQVKSLYDQGLITRTITTRR